ncbi:MAG: peptidyl-prolyl cis-trans isomerase [Myxococcota bacterium]
MALRATSFLVTLTVVAACDRTPPAASASVTAEKAGVAKDVVATVNGTPVTRFEVVLRQRVNPPQPSTEASADPARAALDAIITDELLAQRAKALGHERDPAFLEEMARVEAQVAEVRRRELAKLFLHKEIIGKVDVSDADARAHFDAYPKRFRSEFVVAQLALKGRAAIDAAAAELAAGKPFDDVARALVPQAGAGEKPWVLPAMRWADVPPAWWSALDALEPGQVSAPIAMANDRWVLLQLLERRPLDAVDFDALKPSIQAQLKAERIEALRASTEAELRRAANVTRLDAPGAANPAL